MNRTSFKKASQYALSTLETGLLPELTFHNLRHTVQDTLGVSRWLASRLRVTGTDRLLLLTAAAFHDIGMTEIRRVSLDAFLEGRKAHEGVGAQAAGRVLPGFGYSLEEVQAVQRLILATRWEHTPTCLLEKIIRDADLSSIGREVDFYWRTAEDLLKELTTFGVEITEKEWFDNQAALLESHRFYTAPAIRRFDRNRLENLAAVRAHLKRLAEKAEAVP